MNPAWYFTAPWDPEPVRRGDPLGFRGSADHFAELLAPGLSNGTSDARWISILSWCLKWSHIAWQSAGGGDLSRREDQRARYAWLRPLELLWVARTLSSGQDTGQLRGRRSVNRWFNSEKGLPNFAMSSDQFRRYRQVGTYGAYRVVFRAITGLTAGDGWTPNGTALALAKLVNDSLPREARLKQEHFESGTRWGNWIGANEARYWVERGWPAWEKTGGILPTPDDSVRKQLPETERNLIRSVMFSDSSILRMTAIVLAGAETARTHADLCDALASSKALSKRLETAVLASLPAFTRFADAAMHAMRGLWYEVNHDDANQAPAIKNLARSADLQRRLNQLAAASGVWLTTPDQSAFPNRMSVTELADAMKQAKTPSDQIRALIKHHHKHGGGRNWFREQGGKLVPLVADTGIATSDYRFRLRSLCLLAAQCDVANMNSALNAMAQEEHDAEEENDE